MIARNGSTAAIVTLTLLLCVGICWITSTDIGRVNDALATANSEKRGLRRIDDLRTVFLAISAERAQRQQTTPGTVPKAAPELDTLIARISADEAREPLAGDPWNTFVTLWHEKRGTDERSLFDALNRAFIRASVRSRLSYDSEDAGLDLDDAGTYRFPVGVEALQRTALHVDRLLRSNKVTVLDRLDLTEALSEAQGDLRFGFDDVTEAELRDRPLIAALEDKRTTAEKAMLAYVATLTAGVRADPVSKTLLRRIDSQAHTAIGSLNVLQNALSPAITSIIDARIGSLQRARVFDILRASAGVFLALFLAWLYTRNTRHRAELVSVRRESARLASEARFRVIFERASIGIVVIDREGAVCEANAAFERMLGYPPLYFIGKRLEVYTVPEDRDLTRDHFSALQAGEVNASHYEKRYVRADGSTMWADVSITRLADGDPEGWFTIGLIEDVSERKQIEDRLLYDATHDALTGLANRTLFAARLDSVLAGETKDMAAVIFIDLDHFKVVNDSLGHAAGDRLLRTVADRLCEFVGPHDIAARFGGDEFAVLFSALPHVADLTRRVNLIQQRVAEPLVVDGRSIYTSASIGVAPLGPRYARAEDLLRDADTAMYRAKAEGRARAALFDHAMHEGAMRRLQLASDLREALDRGELRLAYQPIMRLSDGKTIAYEALMRWEHPRDGLLLPDDFIPLAEETGLIIALGRWMMNEACGRLARFRKSDPNVAMHINLSVQEVMRTDTAAFLGACIARHELAPTSVIVEITENAIIESTRNSDASLRNLRELGVGVCIDDFGVGYSSLRYLHRFPISGLKIDRSFVTGTDDDLASEPIVRMLLELARTLGLDVVAEGIESERQSAALQILGCLYGQGYLYSVPQVEIVEHDRTAATP
jgi:diguanylate cyclase (GGDEF)-like protein/PAS domain S-box-containing protein